MPRAGTLNCLVNSAGQRLGVVETLSVAVVPIFRISREFAEAEGEGFTSVDQWRRAHEQFWGLGPLPEEEPVVTEHIRYHPHLSNQQGVPSA